MHHASRAHQPVDVVVPDGGADDLRDVHASDVPPRDDIYHDVCVRRADADAASAVVADREERGVVGETVRVPQIALLGGVVGEGGAVGGQGRDGAGDSDEGGNAADLVAPDLAAAVERGTLGLGLDVGSEGGGHGGGEGLANADSDAGTGTRGLGPAEGRGGAGDRGPGLVVGSVCAVCVVEERGDVEGGHGGEACEDGEERNESGCYLGHSDGSVSVLGLELGCRVEDYQVGDVRHCSRQSTLVWSYTYRLVQCVS